MAARHLDDVAAAAMPASVEEVVAGWRCRAAPDLPFRRCRSIVPAPGAGRSREGFDLALAAVRRWSAAHDQRLLVVVPSWLDAPGTVDGWLAQHGLVVEAPVEVLTLPLGSTDPTAEAPARSKASPPVEVASLPLGPDRPEGGDRAHAYRRLLARHGPAAVEVEARSDGRSVGRTFGVVVGHDLGIFGMEVDPGARRRGIGRALLDAVLREGAARGARRAFLQVEADGAPALALYRSAGFASHHRYRYRAAP